MKFLLSVKTEIKLFITQGIIMNENMDTARDKKCASRRRIIRKAFSLPAGSTLRSHTPLSQEVAFARAVLFPSFIRKWVLRRAYERCKVIGEIVKKLKNPSFEHVLQIAASTVNPDPITRDLNAKGNYKRRVSSKKQIKVYSLLKLKVQKPLLTLYLMELCHKYLAVLVMSSVLVWSQRFMPFTLHKIFCKIVKIYILHKFRQGALATL